MNQACFIYYAPALNEAWCCLSRLHGDHCGLLFTCPLEWKPKNQAEFNAAARFYQVSRPEIMKYNPDEVPF